MSMAVIYNDEKGVKMKNQRRKFIRGQSQSPNWRIKRKINRNKMKYLQKRNEDDDVVEVKKERAAKKEKREKQTEEEKELRKEKKLIKKRVSSNEP